MSSDPVARIAAVAELLLERMPEDLRVECQTLAELDPESMGIRIHRDQEADLFHVVWVNRWLGSVSGAWVRGEVPDAGVASA